MLTCRPEFFAIHVSFVSIEFDRGLALRWCAMKDTHIDLGFFYNVAVYLRLDIAR